MPAVVGTKSGPKAKEQSRGWKEGGTFLPPHFSFLLGLKSGEEEEFSISGINEAPGSWMVDLVVQYYKICLGKKTSQACQWQPKCQPVQLPNLSM